jgi:lipopolysaccharide biosynthesis glycosyltransferase
VTNFIIGCATDAKFVDMTCAMLSSVDDMGQVADATVLVAAFGLTAWDRRALRASAGALGRRMIFVPVFRQSPKIVALPTAFDFPLPLLGRLILPREVATPGARMLLLDSDMIVNTSLRPLVDLDMGEFALAAVEDPWVKRNRDVIDYFNAGLMLLDLDQFNAADLGAAAMRWLAERSDRPDFLDQDALNAVLQGRWHKLPREWNFFHGGDDYHFTLDHYSGASIIHFAGRKPWEEHSAASIYYQHLGRSEHKIALERGGFRWPVDAEFVASCYEVLLGRDAENDVVLKNRVTLSQSAVVASIVQSQEFHHEVYRRFQRVGSFGSDRYVGVPSIRQRHFAGDRLPVLRSTAILLTKARDWREFLGHLLSDANILEIAGLPALPDRHGAASI